MIEFYILAIIVLAAFSLVSLWREGALLNMLCLLFGLLLFTYNLLYLYEIEVLVLFLFITVFNSIMLIKKVL